MQAMISKAHCSAAVVMLLAGCATGNGVRRLDMRYPVKQVVRQDMVVPRSFDSVQGKHPPPMAEPRYYVYAPDGTACEVDDVQYGAIKPGDWISCDWHVER
jgi:hypothetical protein